jgi:hypothetical protein
MSVLRGSVTRDFANGTGGSIASAKPCDYSEIANSTTTGSVNIVHSN